MFDRRKRHEKNSSDSSSTSVETSLSRKRSFSAPSADQEVSSHQQELPDLQTLQERSARFRQSLSRMKVHGNRPAIQPKLAVGAPGDKYEQEADQMAERVMSMEALTAQQQPIGRQIEEQEEPIQSPPLAASLTPLIQGQLEAEIPTNPSVPRAGKSDVSQASSSIESRLASLKGGGSSLPDEVKNFMEPRFDSDLSGVRIHTGGEAVQLNKELGAQAFTHGSDVYFGAGRYNPGSSEGKQLLAHELTHVVQQTGAKQLQQKPLTTPQSNKECLQTKISPALSPNLAIPTIQQQKLLGNKQTHEQKAFTALPATTLATDDEAASVHLQAKELTTTQTTEQPKSDLGSAKSSLLLWRFMQTKLGLNLSDNQSKPEAGTMTDTVMHMPAPPSTVGDHSPKIQLKCAACEEELQRQPIVGDTTLQAKSKTEASAEVGETAHTVEKNKVSPVEQSSDTTVQRFDIGDAKNWVGDQLHNATNLGASAFADIVAKLAPGLADLIRQGPVGMLMEKIKDGIQSWLSGVMGNVNIGSASAGIQSSFTGAFSAIEHLSQGDPASCKAFANSIKSLQEMGQALMNNPFIKQIQAAFATVSSTFKKVTDMVIAPAFDGLMNVAGSVFNKVTELATTIWNWSTPVRNTLGAAWDWVKKQLGIAADDVGGILAWLKTKASEAWAQIKGPLAPVIEPLKVVGKTLVDTNPVVMSAHAVQAVPQVVQSAQWLWAHKDSQDIAKAAEHDPAVGNTILPQVWQSVQGFSQGVQTTVSSFVSGATKLSEGLLGLLGAVSGVPLLSMARNLVQTLSNGVKDFLKWAQDKFQAAAKAVQEAAVKIQAKIAPLAGVLSSLALAAVNPSMIPVIIAGQAWQRLDDCYKAPIINFLLDTVVGLLQAAPSLPMFGLLWPLIKSAVIGFLQGVRSKDDKTKVAISNKLAKIISGGSPAFMLGFVKEFLHGMWDGVTMPFTMIYSAVEGLSSIITWLDGVADQALSPTQQPVSAQTKEKLPASAANQQSVSANPGAKSPAPPANKAELGQRMKQMGTELQPPVNNVTSGFMPGVKEFFSSGKGMSFQQLEQKLGAAWAAVEKAIKDASGTIAEKVCDFLMQGSAEGAMGETIGYWTGMFAVQAILDLLTAGAGGAAEGALKVLGDFAKFLKDPFGLMEKAAEAMKFIGGFVLDGLNGVGKFLAEKSEGAIKAVFDALGEIGQKLKQFAEELLGRFGKGVADDVDKTVAGDVDKAAQNMGDDAAQAAKKEVELPAAIAEAKAITATNDVVNTPAPILIGMLTASVKPQYSWIKGFEARPKQLGHYSIYMLASEHQIDADYTTGGKEQVELGDLVGSGGNKNVYAVKGKKDVVIGVLKAGKPADLIDQEINILNELQSKELPTVKVEKITYEGKDAILMERYAQGSKDIVRLEKGKIRIVGSGRSEWLNGKSIEDLEKIRHIMESEKVKIDDLQFLIGEDGSMVIADPLKVTVGESPSNNNINMIRKLIEVARNNIT